MFEIISRFGLAIDNGGDKVPVRLQTEGVSCPKGVQRTHHDKEQGILKSEEIMNRERENLMSINP